MNSLCIKTNNIDSIQYLLNEFNNIELNDVFFSSKCFKHYNNVIIHYKGNDKEEFISKISSILSFLVIDNYEEAFLKSFLVQNYLYFNSIEKKQILDIYFDTMADDFTNIFDKKFKLLYRNFYNYLLSNKKIFLEGFINFRIKEYMDFIDNLLNESTSNFIVEQEYLEFISLLRTYINSRENTIDTVHIIYSNSESILLNDKKQIINISDNMVKAKYLSDISFSSNDYMLNSLLTLLPRKIYIHLIDNCIDEFINTLNLIFEKRISICTNCNICNFYKNIKKVTSSTSATNKNNKIDNG